MQRWTAGCTGRTTILFVFVARLGFTDMTGITLARLDLWLPVSSTSYVTGSCCMKLSH